MTRLKQLVPLAATMALMAACNASRDDAMDDAMRRDLEAVQAGTMLAPSAPGQQVVSAIERTGTAQPRPTAPRPKAPPSTAQPDNSDQPAPTPDPVVAQQAPVSNEPAASRPTSTPKVNPPPPGGYKTIGDVIRNAPFPIKPAAPTSSATRPDSLL